MAEVCTAVCSGSFSLLLSVSLTSAVLCVSTGSVLCVDSGVCSTSLVSSVAGSVSVSEDISLLSEEENGSGGLFFAVVLLQPVNPKTKSIAVKTAILFFISSTLLCFSFLHCNRELLLKQRCEMKAVLTTKTDILFEIV